MKAHPVAVILLSIILVVWLTQMAKNYLKYLEDKEREKIDSLKNLENQRFFVKEEKKPAHNFKEVLQKNNCDSSTKPTSHPHDFNSNQNINNKFAKNVYRDKSGRFKSKKEWKEAQGTY